MASPTATAGSAATHLEVAGALNSPGLVRAESQLRAVQQIIGASSLSIQVHTLSPFAFAAYREQHVKALGHAFPSPAPDHLVLDHNPNSGVSSLVMDVAQLLMDRFFVDLHSVPVLSDEECAHRASAAWENYLSTANHPVVVVDLAFDGAGTDASSLVFELNPGFPDIAASVCTIMQRQHPNGYVDSSVEFVVRGGWVQVSDVDIPLPMSPELGSAPPHTARGQLSIVRPDHADAEFLPHHMLTGPPHSRARAQLFVTLGHLPDFDATNAVIGHMVDGYDALARMEALAVDGQTNRVLHGAGCRVVSTRVFGAVPSLRAPVPLAPTPAPPAQEEEEVEDVMDVTPAPRVETPSTNHYLPPASPMQTDSPSPRGATNVDSSAAAAAASPVPAPVFSRSGSSHNMHAGIAAPVPLTAGNGYAPPGASPLSALVTPPASEAGASIASATSTVVAGPSRSLQVGDRVSIPMGTHLVSGALRFLGTTQFKPGVPWAGVELDIKGTGKNDGSVLGIKYFECPASSGIFVPMEKVQREMAAVAAVLRGESPVPPTAGASMLAAALERAGVADHGNGAAAGGGSSLLAPRSRKSSTGSGYTAASSSGLASGPALPHYMQTTSSHMPVPSAPLSLMSGIKRPGSQGNHHTASSVLSALSSASAGSSSSNHRSPHALFHAPTPANSMQSLREMAAAADGPQPTTVTAVLTRKPSVAGLKASSSSAFGGTGSAHGSPVRLKPASSSMDPPPVPATSPLVVSQQSIPRSSGGASRKMSVPAGHSGLRAPSPRGSSRVPSPSGIRPPGTTSTAAAPGTAGSKSASSSGPATTAGLARARTVKRPGDSPSTPTRRAEPTSTATPSTPSTKASTATPASTRRTPGATPSRGTSAASSTSKAGTPVAGTIPATSNGMRQRSGAASSATTTKPAPTSKPSVMSPPSSSSRTSASGAGTTPSTTPLRRRPSSSTVSNASSSRPSSRAAATSSLRSTGPLSSSTPSSAQQQQQLQQQAAEMHRKLTDAHDALSRDHEKLHREYLSISADRAQLAADMDRLRSDHAQAADRCDALARQVHDLQSAHGAVSNDAHALAARCQEAESARAAVAAELAAVREKLAAAEDERQYMQTELQLMEEQKMTPEEVQQMLADMDALTFDVHKQTSRATAAEEKLAEVTERLAAAERDRAEAVVKLRAAERARDTQFTEMEKLRETIADLHEHHTGQHQEQEYLRLLNDRKKMEVSYETKLSTLESQVKAALEQVETANAEAQRARSTVDAEKAAVHQQLDRERADMVAANRDKLLALEMSVRAREAEAREWEHQLAAKTSVIDTQSAELSDLRRAKIELAGALASLQSQLAVHAETVAALEREMARVEAERRATDDAARSVQAAGADEVQTRLLRAQAEIQRLLSERDLHLLEIAKLKDAAVVSGSMPPRHSSDYQPKSPEMVPLPRSVSILSTPMSPSNPSHMPAYIARSGSFADRGGGSSGASIGAQANGGQLCALCDQPGHDVLKCPNVASIAADQALRRVPHSGTPTFSS
ncbi:hypothetical protein BC828DRAFT_417118 [Blastocladiella britannica]|nr:hypothetical protein BC828DRAFT_417118 [Blastocladiella britannica]